MSIPLIPESAPFSTEQRAWLNGFFAGVFGLNGTSLPLPAGDIAPAAAPPSLEQPVEESFPWHDPALPLAERLQLAAGKPFERRLMAAMAQLDCGACGYLCRTYSEAIASGAERDLMKCSPGGTETARALKRLVAEQSRNGSPNAESSASAVTVSAVAVSAEAPGAVAGLQTVPLDRPKVSGSTTDLRSVASAGSETRAERERAEGVPQTAKKPAGRSNVRTVRLLESHRLTHPDAPKDTRHVVIDLADSGLTYEPGDSLGILPLNCLQLVDKVASAIGVTGAETISAADGVPRILREALRSDFTLSRSNTELLDLLARHAVNASEQETLRTAVELDDESLISLDVAELLEQFPSARPPLDEFSGALARLQPRLYSIASSPRAHPGQVHLTVGVVRFENLGRWRNGVASHFLGVRSQPGDELRVFVQSSPKFRPPADSNAPMIMVGPGTGIAPFRAFLEDRESSGAKGRNWLFFGNQYMGLDYLYRDELESWLDRGLLARLDLAFSRDKIEKIYVQHRMLEHGAELWRWLQEGAYFYVCGDARRMARDVEQGLRTIAANHGGLSPEQAKAYVAELAKSNRYHKDVY